MKRSHLKKQTSENPDQHSGALTGLAARALGPPPADPALRALGEQLSARFGERVDAIILYGSYRRGVADAMPDLWVLLDAWPPEPRLHLWLGRLLPPNVHRIELEPSRASSAGVKTPTAAKVNVLTTRQLLKAVSSHLAPYFWARFAQPCRLLQCRNDKVRARLEYMMCRALERMWQSRPPRADTRTSTDYWLGAFADTYAAEIRSEGASQQQAIYAADQAWYDAVFADLGRSDAHQPRRSVPWGVTRVCGKLASAARILKSLATFDKALDYSVWKLERHSGQKILLTERQRRYPLIFAWPVLWRLYRQNVLR